MPLTPPAPPFRCLRCDRALDPGVRRCPDCGAQTPTGKAGWGITAALYLGVPIVIAFFGVGWFVNNGSFGWLVALHPIDKISCAAAASVAEVEKSFNQGAGPIRLLRLVGLGEIKQVSRTADELRCSAAGRFDDRVQRPVSYSFSEKNQQISLAVDVP